MLGGDELSELLQDDFPLLEEDALAEEDDCSEAHEMGEDRDWRIY
jgi:hypothetical protein